eukprot:14362703-Heterocapsa_arctica.AAC.1
MKIAGVSGRAFGNTSRLKGPTFSWGSKVGPKPEATQGSNAKRGSTAGSVTKERSKDGSTLRRKRSELLMA